MSDKNNAYVRQVAEQKYEFGFTTDVHTEIIEKGLNEDIVRLISAKKGEPEWMLEFRLKAFRYWKEQTEPKWGHVHVPPIDYQEISYYADPLAKKPQGDGKIDPELEKTFDSSVTRKSQSLFQGNTQLVERLLQLRINLTVALGFTGHRVSIVADTLIVNLGYMHMSPFGLRLLFPVAERLQAELEHPLGLPFLSRDEPNDVLVQPFLYYLSMYVGGKAKLVFLLSHLTYKFILLF